MLGAGHAVLLGSCKVGTPFTYAGRVLGYNPDWYLPLAETSGTVALAQAGPNGTYVNSPQLGVDPIAAGDASGRSVGLSGATTGTPHVIATTPLTGPDLTIDMIVQLDDLTKSKHVLMSNLLTDGFSIEVQAGGRLRAFSRVGSTAFVFSGSAGDVPQGEAAKITYQRQSDVAGWSQRLYVNGVLKAEDPTQRSWGTIAAGTVYLGTWWDGSAHLDPTDGLIAHVAGWNSLLAPDQIQALARTQSVAWADSIDAGAVQASQSKVVSVRQGGWHGRLPLVAAAGNGSLVTTTESGEEITILAGGTSGNDDAFSYSFTDANGNTSQSRTVTVDVTTAPVGVSIGALIAFQAGRIQVTALPGWPGARTPKEVVTQGTRAHGYVRRSWKPTNNDGTWMDFQAGWRKTASPGVIRVKLDDDSELDLSYTVTHSIPSPGSGGTTRTLDKLGGGNFTTWTAAIAACNNNDVLVVRARAGGEVYPIDLNVGGAVSTAGGVKVVAHPDDLAAGRRPRIHVQGTKFARYADELNAGNWIVDTDLGGVHGKVWKSALTVSDPVNVGCSYRSRDGRLRRCYTYTNTSGTPGALTRLRDKIYPRVGIEPDAPAEWDLYMGPGIYWHSSDQRLYIRLSAVRAGVGAIQVNAAGGDGPNPPYDWSDDDPANEDPNQCQLYISSSNDGGGNAGAVSTNISYVLRINGTSNWLLENLDFVEGGDGIQMRDGSGHIMRGCRWLGGAPPNIADEDSTTQSTIGKCHSMIDGRNSFNILADRCEFWGGQCPWVGWDENKGRQGAYPIPHKNNLVYLDNGSSVAGGSFRFLNCIIDGFPTPIRGGRAEYVKFHQSQLRYWGMDGAIITTPPTVGFDYIRCQLFEGSLHGFSDSDFESGIFNFGYNLWTNFRPFCHEWGFWKSNASVPNYFACCKPQLTHGLSTRNLLREFYYNNTSIGSHNHLQTGVNKSDFSGMAHDGAGAGLFPAKRGPRFLEWISRNNVLAVRPNGSLGDSSPTTGGPSIDSHVGVVMHPNHVGNQVGGTFSQNYNLFHRGAGMPSVGFSGVITTLNAGGSETARNSITDVRNDTGQEQNGGIADPQFIGTWDATRLDHELQTNAQWCIPSGSPAASGGDTTDRTWPDMDFGAQVNYGGNTWRGCMDPAASAVEQQVGPLGPLPSGL